MSAIPLWKQILRNNFTHLEKLANFLELNNLQREKLLEKSNFPLNLPLRLAQKIEKGTLEDPILKQFLPTQAETQISSCFNTDPVQDQLYRKGSKLLHKYEGRVLLVCTSACAMHCRYCFRQNFNYEIAKKGFEQELELIRQDPSIHEVILSGGDPLSLSNEILKELLKELSSIKQIRRIRFHTRFPIGIPERIDHEFLAILQSLPCQVWFVVHVNHPKELDEEVLASLQMLQRLAIPVLNQSVLLRGVNDDKETLKQLCELFANHGILPYYIHQLDRVQGAEHFEVPEQEGLMLIEEITKQLPGYAVPKYVKEIPGKSNKTSILLH